MVQPHAVEVAQIQGAALGVKGRVHGEEGLDGEVVRLADAQAGVAPQDLVPLDAVGRQRGQHGLRGRGLEAGGGGHGDRGRDHREEDEESFAQLLHREVDGHVSEEVVVVDMLREGRGRILLSWQRTWEDCFIYRRPRHRCPPNPFTVPETRHSSTLAASQLRGDSLVHSLGTKGWEGGVVIAVDSSPPCGLLLFFIFTGVLCG